MLRKGKGLRTENLTGEHPTAATQHSALLFVRTEPVFAIGLGLELGDHFNFLALNRLVDGAGGGEDRDLQLLVPKFGLLGFDLVVEIGVLVRELELLLAELENEDAEDHAAEETDEKFNHW